MGIGCSDLVDRRKNIQFIIIQNKTKKMWRRVWLLKQNLSAAVALGRPTTAPHFYYKYCSGRETVILFNKIVSFSSSSSSKSNLGTESITFTEAKKLMRLVNVEALKIKLGMEGKEVIGYPELLEACSSMGIARTTDEAIAFARVLDEAGVVLLFRDKVYLHPDKVVDLVRRAVPLALHPEDDPVRVELKALQEKKEEIDVLAHKQVRRVLWFGLGLSVIHIGLFFRLTFWEFSWDVMEPIAFFSTTTGLILGYAYFLITSRDPTYQDLLKRLFLSRQRRLCKKLNFDVNRFKELQIKCKTPLHASACIKNRTGLEIELEDALHRD